MGHSWPLFLYFVFLIELHVNKAGLNHGPPVTEVTTLPT